MAARHLIIVMDLKAFHLGQFLLSSHTGKVTQDDLLCDFALCSETSGHIVVWIMISVFIKCSF